MIKFLPENDDFYQSSNYFEPVGGSSGFISHKGTDSSNSRYTVFHGQFSVTYQVKMKHFKMQKLQRRKVCYVCSAFFL